MKNLYQKISLGEGNTPLFRLINVGRLLNWQGEIWAKSEYQNPTGSFKDRGSIVEITEALKQKRSGVVCASTGNMAASLSAYASRAGLKCLVVIPTKTPAGKLRQTVMCGAKLIKIDGNYDQCISKAEEIAEEDNFLLCGDYELRRKGQKTLGIELSQSLMLFDAFIVPVGNGTLGCAIAEGFAKNNQYPKFIGVQGKGADPITQAWRKYSLMIRIIENPKTIASAMKVGNPLDGELTLEWVNKTKGMMVSVSDQEILQAQQILARKEGIFVETAAAATLSGLIKIKNKLNNKLKIVLILTGSGLKEGGD